MPHNIPYMCNALAIKIFQCAGIAFPTHNMESLVSQCEIHTLPIHTSWEFFDQTLSKAPNTTKNNQELVTLTDSSQMLHMEAEGISTQTDPSNLSEKRGLPPIIGMI